MKRLLSLLLCLLGLSALAQDPVTIDTDRTLAADDQSLEGKAITVAPNVKFTVSGAHSFASLALQDSAILTHPQSTATKEEGLDLTVTGAVTLDYNARIDVTGKGFPAGYTRGANSPQLHNLPAGRGGAHGSYGVYTETTPIDPNGYNYIPRPSGEVYGDFRAPYECGSGGGLAVDGTGLAGGGRVRIRCDSFTSSGIVQADGESSADGIGPGAGGSIWIKANTWSYLYGQGFSAQGGSQGALSHGPGTGGGGRIFLENVQFQEAWMSEYLFYGVSSASGAKQVADAWGYTSTSPGSAGTVYVTLTEGLPIIYQGPVALPEITDNTWASIQNQSLYRKALATPIWFGVRGQTADDPQEFAFELRLNSGHCHFETPSTTLKPTLPASSYGGMGPGSMLLCDGPVQLGSDLNLAVFAEFKKLLLPVATTVSLNVQGGVLRADELIRGEVQDLNIGSGTYLIPDLRGWRNASVNGALALMQGRVEVDTLTIGTPGSYGAGLSIKSGTQDPRLEIRARVLTVSDYSVVTVSGRGPRPGLDQNFAPNLLLQEYEGGSHGGIALFLDGRVSAASPYDNERWPQLPGQGGHIAPGLTANASGGMMMGNDPFYTAETAAWQGSGGGIIDILADEVNLAYGAAIAADGSSGYSYGPYGGPSIVTGAGAGGSILLRSRKFQFDPNSWQKPLSAAGADTYNPSTGNYSYGAGGRVAVYSDENGGLTAASVNVQADAYGNYIGPSATGDGSVYIAPRSAMPFLIQSAQVVDGKIRLFFNKAVDAASFTTTDVSLTKDGQSVAVQSLVAVNDSTWDVSAAFASGSYDLTVGPALSAQDGGIFDLNGDGAADSYHQQLQLSATAIPAPVISSHDLAQTYRILTAQGTLTVTGSRPQATYLIVNGANSGLPAAAGEFSLSLPLHEGLNTFNFQAADANGNLSEVRTLNVVRNSAAPQIVQSQPAGNSYLQNLAQIQLKWQDSYGSPDLGKSSFSLSRNGQTVNVQASVAGDQITLVPSASLEEGYYTLAVHLADEDGLASDFNLAFTIDRTAPVAPTVNEPGTVATPYVDFQGTKEAGSGIRLGEFIVVPVDDSTTWSYRFYGLLEGFNDFAFSAVDRAGNIGAVRSARVGYGDTPPGLVSTLTLDPRLDGTSVNLAWPAYDVVANGDDIVRYDVYAAPQAFTSIAGMTKATSSSVKSATVTGLARNTPVFLAVVAVDRAGHFQEAVQSIETTPVDIQPPAEIANVIVSPSSDSLALNWNASSSADCSAVLIFVDGASQPALNIPAGTNAATVAGLSPDSAHQLLLVALDGSGNRSSGVQLAAYTLMPNPSGLQADAGDAQVRLTWNAVAHPEYLSKYRVYLATSNFSSVSGMTPRAESTGTSLSLAGLVNGQTYFAAVTAVNKSGAETTQVQTISFAPVADTQGPVISGLALDGAAVVPALSVGKGGTFVLTANDPSGLSRAEFALEGRSLSDLNPADGLAATFDLLSLADGAKTISVKVYDNKGNFSTQSFSFTFALAVPDFSPSITSPANAALLNREEQSVTVQGRSGVNFKLYLNGAPVGSKTPDASGKASFTVILQPGANTLKACAFNRAGEGAFSPEISVTLDKTVPVAPQNFSATAKEQGQIALAWSKSDAAPIQGFRLYRARQAFTQPFEGTLIQTLADNARSFTDLPAEDGLWYYRVSMVNLAGTEGELSSLASAKSDRIAPQALSVEYTPQGPAIGNRFGPGLVGVKVTVSETLLATPFLSIVPEGGVPMSVELTKTSDTVFTGSFRIASSTPSGTAFAVLSARDLVGQRGTDVLAGKSFTIDTQGPILSGIVFLPGKTVQNKADAPVTLTVQAHLDQAPKAGTQPTFTWSLSKSQPDAQPVTELSGSGQDWSFQIPLSAQAGQETEELRIGFSAEDDLGNRSSVASVPPVAQIYQGELPPPLSPFGFTGKSLPAGNVELKWLAVEGVSGYRVFRQSAPGAQKEVAADVDAATLTYTDLPAADGNYIYSLASVRSENNQESIALDAETLTLVSDRTAPPAPTDLSLELLAEGIRMTWVAPAQPGEPITYSLFKAGQPISDASGLTALAKGLTQLSAIDPNPNPALRNYSVCAVDAVGNLSAPAPSQALNVQLLPVSTLSLNQLDGKAPVVSWTHPGGASIREFQVSSGSQTAKVTQSPFTDGTWTNSLTSRTYSVAAVDDLGAVSLARDITLPTLEVILLPGQALQRGLMNRVQGSVRNLSGAAIPAASLRLQLGVGVYESAVQEIPAGAETSFAITVPGLPSLVSTQSGVLSCRILPVPGTSVSIASSVSLPVTDGTLPIEITGGNLVKGVGGKVAFTLRNPSAEDIEIVTATNGGDSSQVRFRLVDAEGNTLATSALKQLVGPDLVALSSGFTVARLASGSLYSSPETDLFVPSSAPDTVFVLVEIDAIHHHLGKPDAVSLPSLRARREISLVSTAYSAIVDAVTPSVSRGTDPVTITGRALDRSNQPIGDVAVKVGVSVDGFDRVYDVRSQADGSFSLVFTPVNGEAGLHQVWAVHPDRKDKSYQASFTIAAVAVSPGSWDLTLPYDIPYELPVEIRSASGTVLNHLRLEVDGALPAGLHAELPSFPALAAAGQSFSAKIKVWGETGIPALQEIRFKVLSDEGEWAVRQLKLSLVEQSRSAYLRPEQNSLKTGLAQNQTATHALKFTSAGNLAANAPSFRLLDDQGNPAPSWLFISSVQPPALLNPGESTSVQISLSPGANIPEANYLFSLEVSAANAAAYRIPLLITVSNSQTGNVLFKVSDIYTATLNSQGEVIEGLKDATITIQKDGVILDNLPIGTTDIAGEALLQNLPIGHYSYTAKATGHTSKAGTFWVYPGTTSTQPVHLDSQLITVEWSVVPTSIKDKYDIVLNTTFATSVPAAVVTVEPAAINLPDNMKAGQTYTGEFKFTNHGLIRADQVKFNLPASDSLFKFETLGTLPDKIEAGQTLYLPYRITCVNPGSLSAGSGGGTGADLDPNFDPNLDPDPDDEEEEGEETVSTTSWTEYVGPCKHVLKVCTLSSVMRCANGVETPLPQVTTASYARFGTGCDGPPSSGGSGGSFGDFVISGGGGGWSGTATGGTSGPNLPVISFPGQTIPTVGGSGVSGCEIVVVDSECHEIDADSLIDLIGCGVDRLSGNYTDGASSDDALLDLETETFGYTVALQRTWSKGRWRFEHDNKNLTFAIKKDASNRLVITDLTRNGIKYSAPEAFISNSNQALELTGVTDAAGSVYHYCPDGYRANNSSLRFDPQEGRWNYRNAFTGKEWFDAKGRCLGYGDGTKVAVIFDRDESGFVAAIKNRKGVVLFTLTHDAQGHLTSAKDRENREVKYTWEGDRLLTYTNPMGEVLSYGYDLNGRIISKTSPEGVGTVVEYYTDGRVAKVTEGDTSHSYSWHYDSAKSLLVCTVKDSDGGIEETWMTNSGNVVRADFNGRTVYKLDVGDRESVVTDAQGLQTIHKFDDFKNIVETRNSDGTVESFKHGVEASQLNEETSPTGIKVKYEYDGNYNLTRELYGEGTPFQFENLYEYDAEDQLIKTTRRSPGLPDRVSSTSYDNDGHVVSETDEEGEITTILARNSLGQPLEIKDSNGLTSRMEYDLNGRLIKTIDGLGRTQLTEWNKDSLPHRVTDAKGKVKTNTFSARRLLTGTTDRRGGETKISYSPELQPLKITRPDGSVSQFEYDAQGRMIASTTGGIRTTIAYSDDPSADPLKPVSITAGDRVLSFSYDNFGRLVKSSVGTATEPEKMWTRQTWNELGLITAKEESTGQLLRFEYDQMLNITATWLRPAADQPEQLVSRQQFNAFGDVVASIDAAGKQTNYAYSPSGRLVSITTPEGRQIAYAQQRLPDGGEQRTETYPKGNKRVTRIDAQGRVVNVSIFASGVAQAESSWTYEYDELDQVTAIKDAAGQVLKSFAYDEEGAVTSASSRIGGQLFTESYRYAVSGRLESMTRVDGAQVGFAYDEEGRLVSLNSASLGQVNFADFFGDSPRRIGLPGGIHLDKTFDAAGHLARLHAADPVGNSLLDRTLSYDLSGNLTGVNSSGEQTQYRYDGLHQLLSWQRGSEGESYLLDAKGNRLGQAPFGTQPQAESVFDGDDKLLSSPGASYEHDLNGNLTRLVRNGRDLSFVYNAADQLVEVHEGTQVLARYSYDCQGRRDSKQTSSGLVRFLYDGNARLIAELNDQNSFRRVYTWYGMQPLALEENGQASFFLCDERNAPVKLVTPAGAVLWQAIYAPFGAAVTTGDLEVNLRLPGQYFDAETSLHYNMARYYDPLTGRYTQPDPIMADANAYGYAGHNPFARFDPFGTSIVQNLSKEEALQLVAALGSILPNPAGWAADAAGVLASLAQGDLGGAVTSALGAVPILGDAATAAKLGQLLNKFKNKLPLKKCNCSFSPETEVLLADGTWKKLKNFDGTEQLLADNPDFPGGPRACKVEGVLDGNTYELYDIGLDTNGDGLADGNSVQATPLHPFFTRKGWVFARDLKLGDEVKTDKETYLPVRKHEKVNGFSPTYNLSVETEHCYFVKVAGQAVVVHNAKTPWVSPKTGKCHGNSSKTTNVHHVYKIESTNAVYIGMPTPFLPDLAKYGISGEGKDTSGESKRAKRQVNKFNSGRLKYSNGDWSVSRPLFRSQIIQDNMTYWGAKGLELSLTRYYESKNSHKPPEMRLP